MTIYPPKIERPDATKIYRHGSRIGATRREGPVEGVGRVGGPINWWFGHRDGVKWIEGKKSANFRQSDFFYGRRRAG